MEQITAKIYSQIDKAIEDCKSQICETYGADPEDDNAHQINNDLKEFITSVMNEAFTCVRDSINEELNKAMKPGTLASIEAKIDSLLAKGERVQQIPIREKAIGGNQWSRYQKAWYNWKRGVGGTFPVHAGDRSKMCASDYKEFKAKSASDREDFLNEWA